MQSFQSFNIANSALALALGCTLANATQTHAQLPVPKLIKTTVPIRLQPVEAVSEVPIVSGPQRVVTGSQTIANQSIYADLGSATQAQPLQVREPGERVGILRKNRFMDLGAPAAKPLNIPESNPAGNNSLVPAEIRLNPLVESPADNATGKPAELDRDGASKSNGLDSAQLTTPKSVKPAPKTIKVPQGSLQYRNRSVPAQSVQHSMRGNARKGLLAIDQIGSHLETPDQPAAGNVAPRLPVDSTPTLRSQLAEVPEIALLPKADAPLRDPEPLRYSSQGPGAMIESDSIADDSLSLDSVFDDDGAARLRSAQAAGDAYLAEQRMAISPYPGDDSDDAKDVAGEAKKANGGMRLSILTDLFLARSNGSNVTATTTESDVPSGASQPATTEYRKANPKIGRPRRTHSRNASGGILNRFFQ